MDYVKLFKTIEDDDFYIIKRCIDKNVLDEWEKTIKILQSEIRYRYLREHANK